MCESNIPLGADTDDAPWNQEDNEPREYECEAIVTLSKNVNVSTKSYIHDDDMFVKDLSNVDWEDEYQDQYWDIPSLLERMGKLLRKWEPADISRSEKMYLEELLSEAGGWREEELMVNKLD